jgi:hypothetical protein
MMPVKSQKIDQAGHVQSLGMLYELFLFQNPLKSTGPQAWRFFCGIRIAVGLNYDTREPPDADIAIRLAL